VKYIDLVKTKGTNTQKLFYYRWSDRYVYFDRIL